MRNRLRIVVVILLLCLNLTNLQSQDNKLLIKFKDGRSILAGIKTVKNISFIEALTAFRFTDNSLLVCPSKDIQSFCFQTVVDDVDILKEDASGFLYPNPTKGLINFKGLADESVAMKLYNMSGVLVFSARISSSVQSVNVSFLPRGIYMVNMNGQLSKLIKL